MAVSFPFEEIIDNLRRWGCELTDIPGGVRWRNLFGVSEIAIQRTGSTTLDGHSVAGIAVFRHWLDTGSGSGFSVVQAAELNRLACISGIIVDEHDGSVALASRATLFAADEGMWQHIFAPLLCTEAYMQPAVAVMAARGAEVDWRYFGLSGGDAPCPYDAGDFRGASEACSQRGLFSNYSDSGLAVEFPFDPDGVPALWRLLKGGPGSSGRRTFLFTMSTQEQHPFLGRGLVGCLRLPIAFQDDTAAARVVSRLNRWESQAVDMPPFLGSWCTDGSEEEGPGVAFMTFLPNEMCLPHLPRMITVWMGHRAERILPVLEQLLESDVQAPIPPTTP
jgi:hypothetical protein